MNGASMVGFDMALIIICQMLRKYIGLDCSSQDCPNEFVEIG